MTYTKKKAIARQQAIEWQEQCHEGSMSYGELAESQRYFEKMAYRYGLTKEFRENGVI